MISEAVQLSHEELLLILGVMGLPMPLALGPRPTASYDEAGLGVAASAAAGSLAARELLRHDGPASPLAPAAPLAALARAAALAESCLVVAERRADVRRAAHISALGSTLVLHTSPYPRVHRLATLAGPAAAVEWLAELVGARPAAGGLPALKLAPETLAAALDALPAGPTTATSILERAGVPPTDAAAFVAALGPAPARFAVGLVCGLRGATPTAQGGLAISGALGAWWATTSPGEAVALVPACPAAMRRELLGMVAQLTPGS